GRAMAIHQHRRMLPERSRQRMALLLLHDQKVRVAELVMLVPERRLLAHRRAEMKDRQDRFAGNAERHDRRRVMMADRHDVLARLIDAAVDDALGVEMHLGRLHRARIERVLQNVVWLDQQRRARARQQIASGIGRMAHADVAEGVEHAFVGEDAIGERKLLDDIGQFIGHDYSPCYCITPLFYYATSPRTLKARTGRCRPLRSRSPTGSVPAIDSTATWTLPSTRICPSPACAHSRAPRFTTVPVAE